MQELEIRKIYQKFRAYIDYRGIGIPLGSDTADERMERVGCMVRRSEMSHLTYPEGTFR